jgi:tetratricopeptide (TPR) repeat protein
MIFGFTAFECASAELTGAKLYITQKQYDKAKETLLKEVQKNPASDEGWYLLGYLYGDEQNFQEMLNAFDKSLSISKKFEGQINDYKKYAWQTSFNKGVAFFNSAVKTHEGTGLIGRSKKEILECLGQPENTVISNFEGKTTTMFVYSKNNLYVHFGDDEKVLGFTAYNKELGSVIIPEECANKHSKEFFDKAIDMFKISTQCEPDSSVGYENTAIALINMNNTEAAIPVLEKLIKMDIAEPTKEGKVFVGNSENDIINKFGNPKQKIETTYIDGKTAVQLIYDKEFFYLRNGVCIAVTAITGPGKTKISSWIYSRLGQIYLSKGNNLMEKYKSSKVAADSTQATDLYTKAIEVLENGRIKFPTDLEIPLQLGNAYFFANKLDIAETYFKSLVEKEPGNKELKFLYGFILFKSHKYQEASLQLEAVVTMDEKHIDACYNLAATYINWGIDLRDEAVKKESNDKSYIEKFKLAVPILERYLSIKPNDARVWMSLGQVYANLGEIEKSKAAFKKADENK